MRTPDYRKSNLLNRAASQKSKMSLRSKQEGSQTRKLIKKPLKSVTGNKELFKSVTSVVKPTS